MTRAVDLFLAQAARTPDSIALDGARRATYGQLAGAAGDLAAVVGAAGPPGRVVVVRTPSPNAGALALLAVQLAGCVALCVDPQEPELRLRAVVAAAGAAGLLSADAGGPLRFTSLLERPRPRPELEPVAYILFTSGSTGRPKGVLVGHEALSGRLTGLAEVLGADRSTRTLALTSLSFDISLLELLLPLVRGGQVVEPPPATRTSAEDFQRSLDEHSPTVVQGTPSFWKFVLAAGWRGRVRGALLCGGEAMGPALAADLLPRCDSLWNLYGPTEATIWASACRIAAPDAVGLGAALPGTRMWLEDARGGVVDEAGIDGEIVIGGAGIAQGYLDDPVLTGARFTFGDDGAPASYRTGDRARRDPDGTLRFLGRTDGQLKIRGVRVEIGEVESALEALPEVHQAVVVPWRPVPDEPARLAAFVRAEPGTTERALRAGLAPRLPRAVIPATIRLVAEFPMTSAGKVDRVGLAADGSRTSGPAPIPTDSPR